MSRSWEPPQVMCLMKVTGHEFGKSETCRVIYRARISWNFNDARKKKKDPIDIRSHQKNKFLLKQLCILTSPNMEIISIFVICIVIVI